MLGWFVLGWFVLSGLPSPAAQPSCAQPSCPVQLPSPAAQLSCPAQLPEAGYDDHCNSGRRYTENARWEVRMRAQGGKEARAETDSQDLVAM